MKISHIHVWDKNNKGDYAIVLSIQKQLKKVFPGVKIIDFPIESLKDYNKESLEAINASDLIIFGGGGVFYSYFLPFNLKQIKGLNKPLFIYGVGYIKEIGAKNLSKKQTNSVIAICNKARMTSVRDYNTKNFLIENNYKKRIYLVGDPAISLLETKNSLIKKNKKTKLGLNLNYSGWLGFGKYEDQILSAYAAIGDSFDEVYYFQHHPGEKNIYPKIPFKKTKLRIINADISKQKYCYGQVDLIIGMMLHSVVLSFGALTPFINLAYDLRNYSFGEFIGQKNLIFSLDKLDNLSLEKKVKSVVKNREVIIKNFEKKKKELIKKQGDFLNMVKNNI